MLIAWLHDSEGLPAITALPAIAYATTSSMTALRYRSLAVFQQSATTQQSIRDTTVALYVDDRRAIHLLDSFKGQTVEELSVLVHELVHHIQNIAGLRYECPQAREREAYLAQERWLRQFDTSLAEKFEVDPFTVLVNGLCVF